MFGEINPPHFPSNQIRSNKRAERRIKAGQSGCVEVWLGGGPAGEGSARLSLSLAAAWRATHTSSTFACAKKPSVEVPRRSSRGQRVWSTSVRFV